MAHCTQAMAASMAALAAPTSPVLRRGWSCFTSDEYARKRAAERELPLVDAVALVGDVGEHPRDAPRLLEVLAARAADRRVGMPTAWHGSSWPHGRGSSSTATPMSLAIFGSPLARLRRERGQEARALARDEAVLGLERVQAVLGVEVLEDVGVEVAVDAADRDDVAEVLLEELERTHEREDATAAVLFHGHGEAGVEDDAGAVLQPGEEVAQQSPVEAGP